MADSHPFSNAGLGMFGSAESMYAKGAMQGSDNKEGGPIGDFLAGLIGLSPKEKSTKPVAFASQSTGVAPPVTQYEPQTAFPDILQQQYVTPYQPRYVGVPPVSQGLAGFRKPTQFVNQQATTASGYHPATDAIWGTQQ